MLLEQDHELAMSLWQDDIEISMIVKKKLIEIVEVRLAPYTDEQYGKRELKSLIKLLNAISDECPQSFKPDSEFYREPVHTDSHAWKKNWEEGKNVLPEGIWKQSLRE